MQVSQQDQFISHAVIGNQETVTMGVSDDAALMHILSSTLYTYPKLAVVREILCNAWDAHIASGLTDLPLEVTVLDNEIRIRDFGTGIAHEQIGPIYGVYGNSTKRDDSASTGGFGLGSKAPFAYTDNFEVISCHAGQKTVYRVSKSSMEKGGKPSINTIVKLPTDDSGITVTFGIQESDRTEFLKHIHSVLALGEIEAVVNGTRFKQTLPLSQSPTGYLLSKKLTGTLVSRINLRYGNVVYPIPEHDDYLDEYEQLRSALNQIDPEINLVFQAVPDSITIAPSREALIFTPSTVAAVKQLLQSFGFQEVEKGKASAKAQYLSYMNRELREADWTDLHYWNQRNYSLGSTKKVQIKDLDDYYFNPKQAALISGLHKVELSSFERQVKIVQEASRRQELNQTFFKKYLKWMQSLAYASSSGVPLHMINRYFKYPLVSVLNSDPMFARVKYKINLRNDWYWNEFDSFKEAQRNYSKLLAFSPQKVVICRSNKEAREFLDDNRKDKSLITLSVGNNKNTQKCVQQLAYQLVRQGFSVRTYLPERSAKEYSSRQSYQKKVGFPTLQSSYHRGSKTFKLNTARDNEEVSRITDPLAFVILNSGVSADRFTIFTPRVSRYVNTTWGNSIAVVTTPQAEKLTKKGVPSVYKFVVDQLDQQVSTNAEFKRYLAFAAHMEKSTEEETLLWYYAVQHPALMEALNLRLGVSSSLLSVLSIMDEIDRHESGFSLCNAVRNKIQAHPAVKQLPKALRAHPHFEFLDFSAVSTVLRTAQPDSPEAQSAYSFLQHLLQ